MAAASRQRLNAVKRPRPQAFDPRISTQALKRWGARRVITIEPRAEKQWLEAVRGTGNNGCRRIEAGDVGKRGGGGRAAERAVLEMSMRCRVVVSVMRRHRHLVGPRAHFQ